MESKFRAKRYTAAFCRECGTKLISLHRHSAPTCSCPNQSMVDGGADYRLYVGRDLGKVAQGVFIFADELEQEDKDRETKT